MDPDENMTYGTWWSSRSSLSLQQLMSHYHLTASASASGIPFSIPRVRCLSTISNYYDVSMLRKLISLPLSSSSSSLSFSSSFQKYSSYSSLSSLSSSSSSSSSLAFSFNKFLILLTILSSFLITSCSAEFYIEEQMIEVRDDIPELFASTLARLARSGTILVDQRPDPFLARASLSDSALKSWEISSRVIEEKENDHPDLQSNLELELELEPESESGVFTKTNSESEVESNLESNVERRNIATITSTATITPPKSTSTASPTSSSTLASSDTSSGLASAATGSIASLPTPFDSGFTSNITSTCSSFMMDFLANETFKSCLPFSLLLQVCEVIFMGWSRLWFDGVGMVERPLHWLSSSINVIILYSHLILSPHELN